MFGTKDFLKIYFYFQLHICLHVMCALGARRVLDFLELWVLGTKHVLSGRTVSTLNHPNPLSSPQIWVFTQIHTRWNFQTVFNFFLPFYSQVSTSALCTSRSVLDLRCVLVYNCLNHISFYKYDAKNRNFGLRRDYIWMKQGFGYFWNPSSLSVYPTWMPCLFWGTIYPRHGIIQAKENPMALSYSNFNQESRLVRSPILRVSII